MVNIMKVEILAKTIVLTGMALWMSVIVFNNIFDPGTNIYNIENTITLNLLKDDPVLGIGLKWRAWPSQYAGILLYLVIAYQLITISLFWISSYRYLSVLRNTLREEKAIKTTNITLTLFSIEWFFFLIGGSWFGYWIKQGPITGVHINMLLFTLALFIFINQKIAETTD